MIEWLTQSQADLAPSPSSWLTTAERERLATMKIHKRRQDWLLGRWTGKLLLQTVLARRHGWLPPLNTLGIETAEDGAPLATYWCGGRRASGPPMSLSHSGDRALCVMNSAATQVGADIERIEPRSEAFVHDYLAPTEIELVEQSPPAGRALHVTAVWSAKEAVLKALRLGLRVDTRAVICRIAPVTTSPQLWVRLAVELDADCRPGQPPTLTGWWRTAGDYVLAVAVCSGPS
jgi:4'-phosphopantetheinyl transferase